MITFYPISDLKKVRKEKGLSQEQLAELLGVSQARVSQYERGYRMPKAKKLFSIAKALGMKLYADNDTKELYFMED